MLTHLDLFSGIGGFALAARRAGIKTVQFVEIDKFCQKVLAKNFPGVPIYDDITTYTYRNGLQEPWTEQQTSGDRQLFQDRTPTDRPFLLTGGFPCQPFSCAGKRRGKEDDRFLWPEMLRVVSEAKPIWIIGENVAGFIDMGLDDCISDLENQGYEVQTFVIPACAVGAPHRRDRVWIVAHAVNGADRTGRGQIGETDGLQGINREALRSGRIERTDCHAPHAELKRPIQRESEERTRSEEGIFEGCDCLIADTKGQGLERRNTERTGCTGGRDTKHTISNSRGNESRPWDEPWLEVATRLCGIFNGLSDWIYRNRKLDKYAKITNAITGQDMPHLWQGFQSESFQWSSGRFNTIHEKENLFTVLWQLFGKSNSCECLPFESKEVQEAYLQNVWCNGKSGCPSQRWEYNEQYTKEHRHSLSSLSHEIALATMEFKNDYGNDRVNRLKALGNAVVPQIPYILMKAISEVTNE